MMATLRTCRALAVAGMLETFRRKDVYVVLVLMGLMIAGAAAFGFFGVRGLEVFLRDVTFTVIGLFSTVLAVIVAARQIPEEVQRRTLYPLMARPISRWQLLLGKWVAASLTAILAFLLLAAAARILLACFGVAVETIFWQYLLLKSLGLVWLCALTVALSVLMTHGAAVVLSLILALGSGAFTRIALLYHVETGVWNAFANVLYGLLPHYDFFDLGRKVTYGWDPVPGWVLGYLASYALLGSLVWLGIGWLRFRRAAL